MRLVGFLALAAATAALSGCGAATRSAPVHLVASPAALTETAGPMPTQDFPTTTLPQPPTTPPVTTTVAPPTTTVPPTTVPPTTTTTTTPPPPTTTTTWPQPTITPSWPPTTTTTPAPAPWQTDCGIRVAGLEVFAVNIPCAIAIPVAYEYARVGWAIGHTVTVQAAWSTWDCQQQLGDPNPYQECTNRHYPEQKVQLFS
ncbi:hypothetical protein IU500_14025 [Nocardia terpenica]|uniref:hypothetical protein n=1 Tax=Nocardia terpenica TaxID=455432 RepID=UPI001894BFD3|nr:hypothetical protein [Nocardia terpenica]MBF6062704.1 hypothetical protein [Nocardia terpenica]MBF6105161.1 hypothetical protein [Nocardia terpenica]MBF6112402.1 hypothetical protein [Nocardia terpenica]MBF6118889.1 hypothetical protein [Nocardia terpenica]MBF6154358.1 hypothetical protein [Nocardia terpenica]